MQWAFFQEIFEAVVMGEVEGARFPEACTCVCGTIDRVVLVDRLSMRSPFTSFFRRPQADLSCIHAGASSGGAKDSYICCELGGEDGCDGEEKEVMVVQKGREKPEGWLRSIRPCREFWSLAECQDLQSYAYLDSCDLWEDTTGGVRGVGTIYLVSSTHHAHVYQAKSTQELQVQQPKPGVRSGLL